LSAFAAATGIDIVHVPCKGAGPAIQDLIAGRVDMMFTGLLGLKDHIAAKRMILLATTGQSRTPATPDVPSVSEAAGIPDYAVDSWQALFAPAVLAGIHRQGPAPAGRHCRPHQEMTSQPFCRIANRP